MRNRSKRPWLAVVAGLLWGGVLPGADFDLRGRVTNDNNKPLEGVRIVVVLPDGRTHRAASDNGGGFPYVFSGSGEYRITAEREGYFRLAERLQLEDRTREIQLVLNPVREVFEAVDVRASGSRVNLDRTTPAHSVSGAEMLSVPFPASDNLKNALRIIPGVVQDARGGVHVNGGAEEQVLYTVNGFNANDPLTGRLEARVSVESVQSIEMAAGRLPADVGKGSAGVVAVATNPGGDAYQYNLTNFFPGFETRKGIMIGNWSPRGSISGPIRRGRAWFSNSLSAQYDQQVIEELPDGADRMSSWRFTDLLHTQVNLTPSQILSAGLLATFWNAPRMGLSPLDPPETTTDRRSRQWFFNARHQAYFGRGALLEAGYAANRTFGREIPQGRAFLCLLPEGKAGNFFLDAMRTASRDQWLANLYLPAFTAAGSHQIKTGADVNRVSYWQLARRTGLHQFRSDGSISRSTVYRGPGELRIGNREYSAYVQDTWRWHPRVLLELGLRGDRDRILGLWTASPRLGIAWALSDRTKISGGYALLYDATSLRLFTRPLDQYSLTTYYDLDGTVARGPAVAVFTRGNALARAPYAHVWNLGLERDMGAGFHLRATYLRRRGRKGFTYASPLGPDRPPSPELVQRFGTDVFDAEYTLANERRDVFDSAEFTVRQTLRRQYGWLASYTRSRAHSNGVLDLNIDDPIVISRNVGPMPWDSPNRFLGWGYLPLFRENWAAAFMVESRTGFPFPAYSQDGRMVGDVNSMRFPRYFVLNLHAERRFVFRKHRWEFRAGFNNLTNHKNPTLVNANVDSTRFMHFYGSQGRNVNFRIRWLGKVAR